MYVFLCFFFIVLYDQNAIILRTYGSRMVTQGQRKQLLRMLSSENNHPFSISTQKNNFLKLSDLKLLSR